MPLRKPSASVVLNSTSTGLKPHRSYDSNRVWGQQIPPSSSTPQTNCILGLVQRLKNKLPCNSGVPLDRLEGDDAIQQSIETLVELSHETLDVIAWTLADLLHSLTKKQVDNTGQPTIEVLQSQLFVLKVLSIILASRWNPKPRSSSRNSDYQSDSATLPSNSKPQKFPEYSLASAVGMEPPPLNDQCAKYILLVMVLFLRQTSSAEPPTLLSTPSSDVTFRDYESFDAYATSSLTDLPEGNASSSEVSTLNNQPSTSSTSGGSGIGLFNMPAVNTTYEKTHMSLVKHSASLIELIAEYAGRIVFHVSASNWNLVLERVREKIRQEDGNPDLLPLQLLAHSALNRHRLVQVLNELSSLLVNMGKDARIAIAVALRAAVWHWIDYFPEEFNDCIRVRGRTEGAPERVFDLLHSLNPIGHGNEKVFWPTLTILNCTTSDRMSSEFEVPVYGAKPVRKEYRFTEEVMKHLGTNSKFAEIALTCAVDMCLAAIHVYPQDEVPLRLIAHDIAHDIKGALSSNTYRKAFWDSYDDIDIALYAEALVAVYRFLPDEDALPLFTNCLRADRSDAVKTCVVRACLTLVQDSNRVPWQKPIDKLQEAVSRRLRDLFMACVSRRQEVDDYGNKKLSASRPRAKRGPSQILADRELLLLGILSLWRASPMFVFVGFRDVDLENLVQTATKIWGADVNLTMKISSASCFRSVAAATFQLPPASPHHFSMVTVIRASMPPTLMSVVTNLISCRVDVETQRLWVSIAYQMLELYARKSPFPHVKEIQVDPGRLPAIVLAETALIISLTSVDNHVSQLAAKSLRLIAIIQRQPGAPKSDLEQRLHVYEKLGDPKIMVVGRLGHQKRIRRLIRSALFPPDVHGAIWQECFWRWRALTEQICDTLSEIQESMDGRRGSYTPTPQQEIRFQWQNLTLFLCAFGGGNTTESNDYTKLISKIPRRHLPDNIRVFDDYVPLIDGFLSDLTDLLVIPDMQIRDIAREALGAELGPKLYVKLLRFLDDTLRDIERTFYEEPIQNFLPSLDQFIAVMKLLLESSPSKPSENLKIDVGQTLHSLAALNTRFSGFEGNRTKIKYCLMCDMACESQDALILRKDTSTRHLILDMIMEWIQPTDDGDDTSLQSDLNMACLRTSVKLLEELHLQPAEGPSPGDDGAHVVSRLFNRYSGALLHGLDTYHQDDLDSMSDSSSTPHISPKEANLRELVITGLTHLVSANAESGFRQCLSLAYDRDKKKRAIFAHVFARVIRQGTKFDPLDRTEVQARRNRLCELVRGSDMILALTICEVCPPSEVEIMISVLLNIFDSRTSLMNLLKAMIEQEVSRTDNEANLFRSNSTCTRFLSAFARIHGYNYVRNLIQPLIKSMLAMPPGCSYELDTTKAADQDVTQNQKNVEFIASSFLTIIGSSIPALPPMFREICAHVAKVVSEVWPESKFAALGALIFLRFISPAVVTPEIVDVELPQDDNAAVIRRGLMVIAKVLQNLANNIFFGKEAYMVVLNKFLEENIANVTRFLSEIIKNSTPEDDSDHWHGNASDESDFIVLHRFFVKHADKIGRELLSLSKPLRDGVSSISNGKHAWDELCALLVDLKSPFEAPIPSTVSSDVHEGYKQLMTRYARRDTHAVKDIFVETGVNGPGSAFFVLRLSKIDVEALDIELLMYHIFRTLSKYDQQTFEIILDCTSFTTMSEVPLQWLKYCAELIPLDIRCRLMRTHILNPNGLMQKYLRRLYNVAGGMSFCGEVKTYMTVAELSQQLPGQALTPLPYAMGLETEQRQVFNEVTMKMGISYLRKPAILEIGSTHLRLTSVRKQSISPGLLSNSTEVIPLADVSDVYNVSTGQDFNEFIIRRSRQAITMYFTSPDREIIVKTIRSAKGRLREPQTRSPERFSRYSNVPAILLHVALQSVDFDDEQLRAAAFDLLGSVCSYLGYEQNPIVTCNSGFTPEDHCAFVMQLSERLADFAPKLTLDFLYEVAESMNTTEPSVTAQRIQCLYYISPWIKNLSFFANATHELYERSGARLRDCVRILAQLSIYYPEVGPAIHKCIWSEVAKLDSYVTDVVLDELVRMAVDGGIGSSRCEAVADILACLSSIGVRAKLYSRLRKTLGKISPKQSISLLDHTNWSEISTLVRLALAAGPQSRQLSHNQFHVPEIIYLTSLVAGAGPTTVRKSIYGIVMNLLQSLYITRSDDIPGPKLLELINECAKPDKLKLFGLVRDTPTSDYGIIDPINDKEYLDILENLTRLLSQIMELTCGSKGLLNVWRARWMSLVTSTAFQLSPAIQIRSFIAMGALATTEVDDDVLYQLLVALRNALFKATESQTLPVISMLRCLCKLVPALPNMSRYLPQIFWLAVALLQSSHFAFYNEATCLLRVSMEKMAEEGRFVSTSVHDFLLGSRLPLEEVSSQLDEMLKLSFEASFSFSLASIIFKGIRQGGLRESAAAALRCLLRNTVRSPQRQRTKNPGEKNSAYIDALGYILALLPLSTTAATYRKLLEDCNADETWFPDDDDEDDEQNRAPRVSLAFLGVRDATTALLVTSFASTMLTTAQGDDAETEMLYNLLSDIAAIYPSVVALICDNLQERVKDIFTNSSNATIIRAVTNIFSVSLHEKEKDRSRHTLHESTSTLSVLEDSRRRRHASALDELGMQGLANSFQFLPPNRGHATKMINWIPVLIERIIG
ncbi:hypothetical protein AMATHDRAFT_80979 [Amanita thiersii Skay4041]|uniref:Ras-GAP domain-containing protein n=1 Tax=Amanita thiersii Skay4041 TaxID=703135 RepID=A0A2A9NR48_9AGAR|nr:hypothetical protein AMATHDRAFT_80979 [Amanita thiersii Skay4041]